MKNINCLNICAQCDSKMLSCVSNINEYSGINSFLPENKKKNEPKSAYHKPDSVKVLELLATDVARLKHPTLPEHALAPRKFRDESTNGLTLCITTYISLRGGFASRVNNGGIYDAKRKKYRPGTSRKGLPDVLATYRGLSLFIEIKSGKDVQSTFQKEVQADQENSGGHYYIARNFTDFKNWFDNI